MSLLVVISTLNQMRTDGVIDEYAIGGAIAATFYLEPVTTEGVDVFVSFQAKPEALSIDR